MFAPVSVADGTRLGNDRPALRKCFRGPGENVLSLAAVSPMSTIDIAVPHVSPRSAKPELTPGKTVLAMPRNIDRACGGLGSIVTQVEPVTLGPRLGLSLDEEAGAQQISKVCESGAVSTGWPEPTGTAATWLRCSCFCYYSFSGVIVPTETRPPTKFLGSSSPGLELRMVGVFEKPWSKRLAREVAGRFGSSKCRTDPTVAQKNTRSYYFRQDAFYRRSL